MRRKLRDRFEQLAAESPVLLVFMVFVVTAALIVPASLPFFFSPAVEELKVNLVAESYGILLDLLILGWLLLWLSNVADRRERKNRYREEIEDALGWRSPVASHRIVSNIRRLNRSGVTSGIELPEAYLKGASLNNVKLNDSQLWGAHLAQASLREARVSGSILAGANFEEADLESARFEGADLRGANLRAADMERAHFENADLRGANLEEADLQYATLSGIGLERASLSSTNLRGATLTEADLDRATLREANLTGAQLEGAKLNGADFTGAQLREADLRGTSLEGTIFQDADLAGVHLTDEDVVAFGAAKTLYDAVLDKALRGRLEKMHPHLFEAPSGGEAAASASGGSEQPSSSDATASDAMAEDPAPLAPAAASPDEPDAHKALRVREEPNGQSGNGRRTPRNGNGVSARTSEAGTAPAESS